MTKKELAAKLAHRIDGLSTVRALEVVNAIFDASGDGLIPTALEQGEKVTIPGFGTFYTHHRDARTGVDPSTGQRKTVPPRTYVKFKVGKTLKERILA